MSNTYQQPAPGLYYGQLPAIDANAQGGDWVVPEEGWNELVFKVRYVTDPNGATVAEVREKIYQGVVQPGKYQIRLDLELTDPNTEVTPWPAWFGWTLAGRENRLRPMLLAIRNNTPFAEGQQLTLDLLRQHEMKPFRALITIDEVRSRQDPDRMMRFANVIKCEPVKRAGKAAKAKATPVPAPAPEPTAEPWDAEAADADDDTFPEIPNEV